MPALNLGAMSTGMDGPSQVRVGTRADLRPHEAADWAWLDSLATESERVRRDEARFDEFSTYLDLFYGKHWPTVLPSFRPPVVANELRTLILSEASDLTETQLRVYITKDPRRADRDTMVERAFRAVWARNEIDLQLTYACLWALIVGTGFLTVGWNPELSGLLGDVEVEHADPRGVLPDPDALDDRKWLYVIREQVLDIQEIRRLFPQSGWRVQPDDAFSVKDTKSAPQGLSGADYVGPLTPSDAFLHGTVPGYKKARARVLDCLIRDDRTDEGVEEMQNPDGTATLDDEGQPMLHHYVRPKYPRGRRIVGANGSILYDGDNPHQDGSFGILRVILEPTLGRFWGTGFVQQTAELQLAADKGLSQVVENAIRLNNGIVISTTNTGLDWESFAGIPAQVVQINPGSEFKIQYPPPMPADMIQFPFRLLDLQKRLLGFEGARGGAPSQGNVSPELTETEIAQAQSTTRLRSRLLANTAQRLAEMIFAHMAWGYTTERSIPAVEGERFEPVTWTPLEKPDAYRIYVDPASFTVMSQTLLRRLSVALFKLRGIDRDALLERLGWPDWQAVSKRMQEADQMMAYAKEKGKYDGKKGSKA
jgi:hypothetical protein